MQEREHIFDPTRIWVTSLIDRLGDGGFNRPLVTSILTLGSVPVVITGVYFGLTYAATTPRFLVSHVLAMLVAVIGPAGIWYWDNQVFPRFVVQTSDIVENPASLVEIAERYYRDFRARYWLFAVPWTALVVAIIGLNIEYFQTVGVAGYADPAFWVYLLFAAWWGLITGIGFHGAITAIRCIHAVGELAFAIEPLHPDGLGGLSAIGNFAIWTTMLISLGSLTLPLAFLLGAEGGYSSLVYAAVGIYIGVIIVSFVYPTVYINRRTQEARERALDDKRRRIRRLQQQTPDPITERGEEATTLDSVATRLEIQRLREEFNDYQSVNLYPLSVGIISRLVSSVLLPLFFLVFEMYLNQFL